MRSISAVNDLELNSRGQFIVIEGKEAVRQAVIHRLRFFLGEWYRYPNEGVAYFDVVLGRLFDAVVWHNFFRTELLSVMGVTTVSVNSLLLDERTRIPVYNLTIDTEYGPIDVSSLEVGDATTNG